MKLLAALLFGAASALQPAQVKPAFVDRRAAMKFISAAAAAARTGRRARGQAAAAPVDAAAAPQVGPDQDGQRRPIWH